MFSKIEEDQIFEEQIEDVKKTNFPSSFTLNLTHSILHSASFNFQPYSRGGSLTLKKTFLLSFFIFYLISAYDLTLFLT